MEKLRPLTRETLGQKLKKLMALTEMSQRELATATGVSQRQISNLIRGENSCSVETADALAKPFGLTGWQLIAPHIPADKVMAQSIERLLATYSSGTPELRAYLDSVVAREKKRSADGK